MGHRLPMRPKLLLKLKLKLLRLPKLSELPPSRPLLIKLPLRPELPKLSEQPPSRPPLIKLPPSRPLLRLKQIAR